MTLKWDFKTWARGDKVRDPIQGEFFSTDAIRNPAEAFVREAVQNSLDAATAKPVRVRFYFSGAEGALPANRMARYLNGVWPHLNADGNGLRDVPLPTDACPFLACEDFSTKGLEGDPAQSQEVPGQKNHFYYFFRTEGKSAKSEQQRGRWGIGKYVFPRSSRISSFLAATVRSDQSRYFMGQAVLKSHLIEGKYYKPDGSLAWDSDGLPMPFDDKSLIDDFCADFKLKREMHPGLSVVVPWYDEEIRYQDLVAASARAYFYAVLKGDLIIEIDSPTENLTLSATTMEAVLEERAPALASELQPALALAKWAIGVAATGMSPLTIPPPKNSYKWDDVEFPKPLVAAIKPRVQAGDRVGLRINLSIFPKGTPPIATFFDVFLVRDESDDTGRPVFIRDGLIISDTRPRHRSRGMRALVIVDDSPLATLLGDSENPAHTQWQRDSSHFKGKYTYGPSYIELVTGSVAAIVRAIVEDENAIDRTLLIDFFSLPSGGDGKNNKGAGEKDKKEKEGPEIIDPKPPKLARFRINRIVGGFSVTQGHPDAKLPHQIEISVAYDVRRGNPMSRYRPADFVVGQGPIKIAATELALVEASGNHILASPSGKEFCLTVTGFDPNRDLVVRGVAKEDVSD